MLDFILALLQELNTSAEDLDIIADSNSVHGQVLVLRLSTLLPLYQSISNHVGKHISASLVASPLLVGTPPSGPRPFQHFLGLPSHK